MSTQNKIYMCMLLFIGIGILVSIFLAYEYAQPDPVGCLLSSKTSNECEIVRQSSYSKLFGIQLPYLGLIYYVGFASLIVLTMLGKFKSFTWSKYLKHLIILGALFGFLFETRYTYLQFFVIEALCKWCLAIYLTTTTLLLLSITAFLAKNPKAVGSDFHG